MPSRGLLVFRNDIEFLARGAYRAVPCFAGNSLAGINYHCAGGKARFPQLRHPVATAISVLRVLFPLREGSNFCYAFFILSTRRQEYS
jgi:hypothetical protein